MSVATSWKGLAPWVLAEAGVEERDGLVFVPYRRRDGEIHNCKVFSPSGRTWWAESGRELIPFRVDALPRTPWLARRTAVLVTEGESDALAANEAFSFWADAVAPHGYIAVGLPGSGSWRREWRGYFELHPVVYVLPDGDAAGERMARAVLADLPWARRVCLPDGEDVRSLLQDGGPRALDPLLDETDADVRLYVALRIARSLDEFERLLADAEVSRAAD